MPSSKISSAAQNQTQGSKGVLIGVTNPFFEIICKGWPHIVSLGQIQAASNSQSETWDESTNVDVLESTKDMRRSLSGYASVESLNIAV